MADCFWTGLRRLLDEPCEQACGSFYGSLSGLLRRGYGVDWCKRQEWRCVFLYSFARCGALLCACLWVCAGVPVGAAICGFLAVAVFQRLVADHN